MSEAMPAETASLTKESLADPALRRALVDFVRRRLPIADVDDVVQTVLCDALAARERPSDAGELRRWVLGIARHKVIDCHRRAHREPPIEMPEVEASPPPIEACELVRWAEKQAASQADAQKTLAWMAREGEGEKLEAIAAEEQVPAARVRQRVSRMRRWMKERWVAELAAVAMLGVAVLVGVWLLRLWTDAPIALPQPTPSIAPEPPSPNDRARALREDGLRACDRGEWRPCLEGLDGARSLDPIGDEAPAIGAARQRAADGLRGDASKGDAASAIEAPKALDLKGDPRDLGKPSMNGSDWPVPVKSPRPAIAPKKGATPSSTPRNGTGSGYSGKPLGKAQKKVMDPSAF